MSNYEGREFLDTAQIAFVPMLIAAVFTVYKTGKLTLTGSLVGGLIATAIYFGAGLPGIALLGSFFALAVLATSWKKNTKRKLARNDHHPEKRNALQVLANGSVAAVAGLLMYLMPTGTGVLAVMMAASLASATADTLSSELGTVYGRRFFNIISFLPDERGRDGVVSLEGTLLGTAGAMAIAVVYAFGFGCTGNLWLVVIAGTAGNIADSVLGATAELRGYLNNDAVNLLNTLTGALVAYLLYLI